LIFQEAPLKGAYLIDPERRADSRGFFARSFCANEFLAAGLETQFVQINESYNRVRGTLRGLHYQLPPSAEVKVVRAVKGALFDVIVDLRAGSPTFLKWFGSELSEDNRRQLYVPRGFAHGYITMTEEVEAQYLVSAFYSPDVERGVRWDDRSIGVNWPLCPMEISEKDRKWPDLDFAFHGTESMRGFASGS
jgi:dTDP-4-dehydrorhamnose 3,5-epimerase